MLRNNLLYVLNVLEENGENEYLQKFRDDINSGLVSNECFKEALSSLKSDYFNEFLNNKLSITHANYLAGVCLGLDALLHCYTCEGLSPYDMLLLTSICSEIDASNMEKRNEKVLDILNSLDKVERKKPRRLTR